MHNRGPIGGGHKSKKIIILLKIFGDNDIIKGESIFSTIVKIK